jgi:hypothetical protein
VEMVKFPFILNLEIKNQLLLRRQPLHPT